MSVLPEVFRYHDYRSFLRDWYLARKTSARLSYRGFARRAGIRSPSYLKLVMDGERNLSGTMAERFATACSLAGDSSEFFCELVRFNQAGSNAERRAAYARLSAFSKYRELHPLEVARDAYHSYWFLPAIRELLLRHDFQEDPEWIASQLIPPIKRSDAAMAVATLLELGLLTRRPDGSLSQSAPLVSSGDATHSVHLGNYHREMIRRAAEALDGVPRDRRDISSVTIAVDESARREITDAIAGFRRRLLELTASCTRATQVVQVNIQLFPLTREAPEE